MSSGCRDCGHDLDHCHGTLVRHRDGSLECFDQDCVDLEGGRHGLVLDCGQTGCTDPRCA